MLTPVRVQALRQLPRAAAGLRVGEALALRWADVDLATGTLRVLRSKTDAGVRLVDLTLALREELAAPQGGHGLGRRGRFRLRDRERPGPQPSMGTSADYTLPAVLSQVNAEMRKRRLGSGV